MKIDELITLTREISEIAELKARIAALDAKIGTDQDNEELRAVHIELRAACQRLLEIAESRLPVSDNGV